MLIMFFSWLKKITKEYIFFANILPLGAMGEDEIQILNTYSDYGMLERFINSQLPGL